MQFFHSPGTSFVLLLGILLGKLTFFLDMDCNKSAYDIVLQCMQIIERLERLSIAKEEYYIMKALILANSDVRMDEFASLKKFRDSILTALSDCVAVIR